MISVWEVLLNRNYALLFWGQLVSSMGTQMRIVALAWQVYLLTHSVLALGAIGLVQALPRIIFSVIGGVFADKFDRRKMLLMIEIILASLSAVLAFCTMFRIINVFIIYTVVLISTSVAALEWPTRQAIIPTLVPREQMADATSLSAMMAQLTGVLGPTIGGFVIAWLGIANAYWLDALSYGVVLASLLPITLPIIPLERRAQGGVAALIEGTRFLRTQPIIFAVILLDFFATFFGSPRALLPVFASDILHVGAQGLGLLLAADSIGALLLMPFTGYIGHISHRWLGVASSIIAWGVFIIIFGLFPGTFWLALVCLAGAGAANMISMLLRFQIIQFYTPNELRGRINAVNAMFAFGGPLLGDFEASVVASFAGIQISILSGGVACILVTLAITAYFSKLLGSVAKKNHEGQ